MSSFLWLLPGRMRRFAGCTLMLLGCSAQSDPDAAQSAASQPEAQEFPDGAQESPDGAHEFPDSAMVAGLTCTGLERSILLAELSRAGLRSTHGPPDSTAAWTEPNRHTDGAVDSIFTVFYSGFTATFRTPPSGRDLVSSAVITANPYLSHSAIGIGASEATIIRALGDPTRREANRLVYDCGETEQPVTFELVNGRVGRIAIEYYVD